MPKAIFSLGDDSNVGFDGLSADSQHAIAARRFIVKQARGESSRSRNNITTRSIIPYFRASGERWADRVADLSESVCTSPREAPDGHTRGKSA
jgi:hypothetical protein